MALAGAVAAVPLATFVPAYAGTPDHAQLSTPSDVNAQPDETHTVYATLTDTDRNTTVAGAPVDLQQWTGSNWQHVGWTKTGDNGVAPVTFHQHDPGTLTFRVYYPGDGAHYASSSQSFTVTVQSDFGQRVLAEAARHNGAPYSYGANGPDSFDCSGFVQYVYAHSVGIDLPRTSEDQYAASRHIPTSAAQPGDLVAFSDGGNVYHVGIYAGDGQMWDAPHSGDHVRKRAIYGAWSAGTFR